MELTMRKLSELSIDTDDPTILMALIKAHRPLAELKGVVKSIPNQQILLSTLTLQEAKDSSEIENIITTQDELYKHTLRSDLSNLATKAVANYNRALQVGHQAVTIFMALLISPPP
jgi:Fic family protein